MLKKLPLAFGLLFIVSGLLISPNAIGQAPVQDLGISFSTPPPGGCNFSTAHTLTVIVHNYGNVTQSAFPLSLKINGMAFIHEIWPGPLSPNASSIYTFTSKVNLSAPGPYMIIARINLVPDSNPSNDADTLYITNSNLPQGNVNLSFETLANSSNVMRKVLNANSGITESPAASNGSGSTKGMIMDGKNSTNWVTPGGTINPWTSNPAHFSATYFCFNPAPGKPNDTLRLSFDLKQLYKTSPNNTNFRITVNGQQVGPTYNPPVGGNASWTRISHDFSAFLGSQAIEIGLESSVKEEYNSGNGTANLIDNMEVERIAARQTTSGIEDNALQNSVAIFPNPSKGSFTVSLPDDIAYQLEVTDLTGKVLQKQEVKSSQTQLVLQGTASGIYLLKISGKEGVAFRKLIVE